MNEFFIKMQKLLKNDFDKYLSCMNDKPYRAIRINTLKCSDDELLPLLPFKVSKMPFCNDGYYIDEDADGVGKLALHHAGAFYVQEPSAMSAVTMLDVKKGDKVLDLCAAPGGKSTQIAAALDGKGVLWSNEIVKSRANILLSNIERLGVKNAIVSLTSPEILCKKLCCCFDKVLVDAPCSGEGMFRKDKNALLQWSEEHVLSCANRQLLILESAKSALKEGGEMVYSTCTFSYEENEGVVTKFLERNPEFELIDSHCDFGRNTLKYAKRIFPFDGGEGHFAAKFRKNYNTCEMFSKNRNRSQSLKQHDNKKNSRLNTKHLVKELCNDIFYNDLYGENIICVNDRVFALPYSFDFIADYSVLSVLRAGVEIAQVKNNRAQPHHNAFTAARRSDCRRIVDLDINDERVKKYLHGEEIQVDSTLNGYTCVCVNNITLGFGKASNGVLKNKYPKGLRIK